MDNREFVLVEGRHPSSDPNHGQDDAGYDSEEESCLVLSINLTRKQPYGAQWQWRAVQRHRAARVVADCALDCPPGEQVDRRPEPRLCFVPDDRTARREGPPALKRA